MLVTTFAELHRRGKSIKVWSSHNFRKRLENFWDCNYLSLDTYILEVLEDLLDVLKRKKREGRQGDILVKTTVSSEDFIVWSPKNGPKSFFLSGGEIFLLVLYIDTHYSKSLHFVGKLQLPWTKNGLLSQCVEDREGRRKTPAVYVTCDLIEALLQWQFYTLEYWMRRLLLLLPRKLAFYWCHQSPPWP